MSLGRALFLFGLALAVVLPLRAWVGEPIYVASPSMEPSLRVGTLLVLDKISLRLRPPRRGEIVSFHSPEGEDADLIKRVVALPGETVELRDKVVYVNGVALDEPYAVHTRAAERLQGDTLGPLVVPSGECFVLGDNRDESRDASVWRAPSGERVFFLPFAALQGLVRRFPWA